MYTYIYNIYILVHIYKYIYIYTNLPVNAIVRHRKFTIIRLFQNMRAPGEKIILRNKRSE